MKKKVVLIACAALLMLALAIPCFATSGSSNLKLIFYDRRSGDLF